MPAIRVAAGAGMPRVLLDMIEGIVQQHPDIVFMGQLGAQESRRCHGPLDLVILGLDDSNLPVEGERLLKDHPDARAIGISADGRNGFIYELRPHRTAIGEVSPQILIEAIRGIRP